MTRKLKDWLTAYLDYTSSSESPQIFHFWAGVSTIAAVLRRRVWIDMRYFEWTPNFYIILVAPAGVVSKSTTIGIGKSLLTEVDGIRFGPDSGTWQAIGKSLMEAKELIPLQYGDLEGEFEEMSCITCTPGELGTFLDFKDYKLIDTLTSLWDGQRGTFEHRTATQGTIEISNPWINIISATTPAWLKKHVPEEAIGGGFASRVVFVFGQKKRHLVAYPGLIGEQDKFEELRKKLIHDLKEMAELLGPMQLSPEAIQWGEKWYQDHWDPAKRPVNMASERFDGYLARKQTHIHKLAMILSISEDDRLLIEAEHLDKANTIMSAMEQDMMKVFESIGVAPASRFISEIVTFIHTYNTRGMQVDQQMLYRAFMSNISKQEFEDVVTSMIKAGYLTLIQRGDSVVYKLKITPEELGKIEQD